MITPRETRLLRAPDLPAFRATLVALSTAGAPLDVRDRLVIVPTRAAAEQLLRAIESRVTGSAVALPDFVTPRQLVGALAVRLRPERPLLTDAEREALLGAACRAAAAAGYEPPFKVRTGLLGEMLDLYDTLHRHQTDVDAFERLALQMLEPGAELDRGAARLVQQTRFLVAAFREFDARVAEAGLDEWQLRQRLLEEAAARAYRHVVVAVGDHAFERHGLHATDWDLLSRVPGLRRLDVVVTDDRLFGAPHERMHRLLPGIEEVRCEPAATHAPSLLVPDDMVRVHTARDREEEIAAFARWAKSAVRSDGIDAARVALVVQQPLPYVYLARELFCSSGIPYQMFDALPLAAEPYAAALDLVFTFVSSGFSRDASIAMLRSPHFRFSNDEELSDSRIAGLDRAMAEAGYLGDLEALGRISGADLLLSLANELAPLREPLAMHLHLARLGEFVTRHGRPIAFGDDSTRQRARAAIHGILTELREAFERFDQTPVTFDEAIALVRRWIEAHTFAPRTGEGGVHVVDAESARFGDFDLVQLAGLVEGEWPGRSRRNIFYGPEILRALGWPAESDRRTAARAGFTELLRLPALALRVSTFSLEGDAATSVSPLVTDLNVAAITLERAATPDVRIFESEALSADPVYSEHLSAVTRAWVTQRDACRQAVVRPKGQTDPYAARAYSLSGLERYQDCPFRFFASHVLRLEEEPEDQSLLTPRRRGQLLHEILHTFFDAWDRARLGPITPDTMDQAQELFASVAEPMIETLPESERALERARLFGSAISVGLADLVLGLEATRTSGDASERWLEYRLEGRFALGGDVPIPLRGVADRIDLLPGRRLRVIDYKSGAVPSVTRALQAPIYALCAQERLAARDGAPWTIEEASYVSLGGRRAVTSVVAPDDTPSEAAASLDDARDRLFALRSALERGVFPPRPYDTLICRSCAFSSVCRKDYAGDE